MRILDGAWLKNILTHDVVQKINDSEVLRKHKPFLKTMKLERLHTSNNTGYTSSLEHRQYKQSNTKLFKLFLSHVSGVLFAI